MKILHLRDVVPFLDAIENMTEYYISRGVDVFKQAVSGEYDSCVTPLTRLIPENWTVLLTLSRQPKSDFKFLF